VVHAAHLAGMDEHIFSDGVVERLWTLDGLAAFLQIPKDTIRTWSKRGDGPKGCKVGRHVRFKASDVEAWLESRDTRGAPERPAPENGHRLARAGSAYDPESEWGDLG
jgi:excisionase family DNA binding protein